MNMRDVLTSVVFDPLRPFGAISASLADVVVKSLLAQLDSKTIIELEQPNARALAQSTMQFAPHTTGAIGDLETILQPAAALTDILPRLLVGFGRVLQTLIDPDDNVPLAPLTMPPPQCLAFLMTDSGGTSIADWQSTCLPEGDALRVRIRKQWAIDGEKFDTAIVLVRGRSNLYPVAISLTADDCRGLEKTPIGAPFLSGQMQLGNVAGEVCVAPTQIMGRNATTSTKVYLSVVRPRFARAIMAHLRWLEQSKQMPLTCEEIEHVQQVHDLATNISAARSFSIANVLAAQAVKLTTNEILHSLVVRRFPEFDDRSRDFLGLAKMEGSTYRCLHELMAYQGAIR
jgi:hypothetical protein